MPLLIKELSLQVARTAIFILLRVNHMQSHVTPPQYTKEVANDS
jgi:hypothetical protein